MDSPILLCVSLYFNHKLFQTIIFSSEIFLLNSIPFELDNLWKYSLVIILSALSIYGVALGKIIIHELYYRGGFQIIACTLDMSDQISEITSIIHE